MNIINTFSVGWIAGVVFCYLLWFGLPALTRKLRARRLEKSIETTGIGSVPLATLKGYHAVATEALAIVAAAGDVDSTRTAVIQLDMLNDEFARRAAKTKASA